jgi:predicted RNA-binding Zn-ribbon protein involved in translation (DUF1610 family)
MKVYPICGSCGGEIIDDDPPEYICADCERRAKDNLKTIRLLRSENTKLRLELEAIHRRAKCAYTNRNNKN